jgi:hypothetical protein
MYDNPLLVRRIRQLAEKSEATEPLANYIVRKIKSRHKGGAYSLFRFKTGTDEQYAVKMMEEYVLPLVRALAYGCGLFPRLGLAIL